MKFIIRKDMSFFLGVVFCGYFMLYPDGNPQILKIGFSMGSGFSWPFLAVLFLSAAVVLDIAIFHRVSSARMWLRASPILTKMVGRGNYFLYGMIFTALVGYAITQSQYALGIALHLAIVSGMLHFYLWSFKGFDEIAQKVLAKQ